MKKSKWKFFDDGEKCGIKTKWATIWFNAPTKLKNSQEEIPADFTWFTWDEYGHGGENGVDDSCRTAMNEATAAAKRQGFWREE